MSLDACDPDKNMLILYSAALIAIRPGITVPDETLSTMDFFTFKYYCHLSRTPASNSVAFRASLRLLCSTVNRRAEDFPDFFGDQLNRFWDIEIGLGSSTRSRSRKLALEIWIWIIKALIVRSDPRGYELLGRVFELIQQDRSEFGRWAARRLSIIFDTKDETLDPKNFAIVKILWIQRVCHHLVSRLVEDYHEAIGEARSTYLVGLATLLARMDSSIVLLEQEKVTPVLLEALKFPDSEVRSDSLATLYDLIVHDKSGLTFGEHLSTLISALLLNCAYAKLEPSLREAESHHLKDSAAWLGGGSEAVRLSTLKILSILPKKVEDRSSSPTITEQSKKMAKGILSGERSKVLQALTLALDDPKRAVRKLAVDCRAQWFSLDLD